MLIMFLIFQIRKFSVSQIHDYPLYKQQTRIYFGKNVDQMVQITHNFSKNVISSFE